MTSDINSTSNVSCSGQNYCAGELNLISPHIRPPFFFVAGAAIVIIGAVGNTLVLLCFCLEKKLRTVSYSLLGHLAMVDLLNCIINIPVYLAMANARTTIRYSWIWITATPFLITLSVYIQGLIGINRFFLVTKDAVEFRRYFGRIRSSMYVTLGWVITAVSIGLLMALTQPPEHDGLHSCSSFSDLNTTRKLFFAMILGFSGIYSAAALVFYIRLALFVRNNTMKTTTATRSNLRTSKILFVLGVFSIVSLFLSPVLLVISHSLNIDRKLSFLFDEIGTIVYFVSYCINPIFFFTKIPLFKTTLKRMFQKRNRVAPTPQPKRDAFERDSEQKVSIVHLRAEHI